MLFLAKKGKESETERDEDIKEQDSQVTTENKKTKFNKVKLSSWQFFRLFFKLYNPCLALGSILCICCALDGMGGD